MRKQFLVIFYPMEIFLDLWKSDNNESMIEAKFTNIMNIEDLLFIFKK